MQFCHLIFICFSLYSQVFGSCGSARITAQADADELSSCPTITGNVVLATNAVGSIKLDGVVSIEGNLTNEQCDSVGQADQLGYLPTDQNIYTVYTEHNCTGLLSLSSSTLTSVSQNLSLQGLLNITNVTFPLLKSVGTNLYLDGLPALSTFSAPDLSSMESLHLAYAQNLPTLGIDKVANVSSVEFNDVGLTTLPDLSAVTEVGYFAAGGMPNVRQLILTTPTIDTLVVNGNGFLDLWLFNSETDAAITNISTLSVSGCSFLHSDSSISIDTLIAVGNSFLDLSFYSVNVSNIFLQNNAQLSSITWPKNGTSMDTVVITGNPLLQQTVWTLKNVTSIILKGSFGSGFL